MQTEKKRPILKSTLLILPILCSPTLAFADGSNLASIGAYGGLGGGIVQGSYTLGVNNVATQPAIPAVANMVGNFHGTHRTQGLGNLFIGYGSCYRNLYGSAELFGFLGSTSTTANVTSLVTNPANSLTNTATIHSQHAEPGLDLRIGILPTSCTLVYGRVGAGFNNFKFKANFDATAAGLGSASLAFTHSKKRTGLRIGAGLEQQISDNLSLRGDYIFTTYGRINHVVEVPVVGLGTIRNSTSIEIKSHAFLMSVLYNFGF